MVASVLFVDDEEYILNALERLFIDSTDVRILKAKSAEDGLKLIESEEVAVVVSDNMMPGMKGVEFLSKTKFLSPDTVKILMTAYADLSTAISAINEGEVTKFIVKPWEDDLFLNIIQESINQYKMLQSLKKVDDATLFSLAQTIELKDPYTRGHSERVANYSLMIANELHFCEKKIKEIKYGSWLHDCGKIGVPKAILHLQKPLNDKEWEVIKKHPSWGAEVARQALMPEVIVNIIKYHHERCDGKGYPAGLKGDEIPVEAKIVAIADTYDAITSDRTYQKGSGTEEGINILDRLKEQQLDSRLVDVFISLIKGKS